VLEATAHHGTSASVPDPFCLGLDKLDTGRNRGRLVGQESASEMMKVSLVERAEAVRWPFRRRTVRASWDALLGVLHSHYFQCGSSFAPIVRNDLERFVCGFKSMASIAPTVKSFLVTD
jgi:hypothetical protein